MKKKENKTKTIMTTNGHTIILDTEDYLKYKDFKWWGRSHNRSVHACRTHWDKEEKKHTVIFLHREIMQPPKDLWVDHINGNGLDNRRSNLRICSGLQNRYNVRKKLTNLSGYIGVVKSTSNKWISQSKFNNKYYYLGIYEKPEEAARVRDAFVLKHRGEFAVLNFPKN